MLSQQLHQGIHSPSPQLQPPAWLIISAPLILVGGQIGQRSRAEGTDTLGHLSPLNVSVQGSWPQWYEALSFLYPEV